MAVSIDPGPHWLGNDGPWSTFPIGVGTPPQFLELLPATCLQGTLVVLQGCSSNELPACGDLRGNVFRPEDCEDWNSSTISGDFLYTSMSLTSNIDITGLTAEVSLGPITLQWLEQHDPKENTTLPGQVVVGYVATDIFVGLLGLSNRSIDLTHDETVDSLERALVKTSNVTSSSWAYTAGAQYKTPVSFGSLTMGGYDSSRVDIEDALTVAMTNAASRDLVVAINNIEVHTNISTGRVLPLLGSPVLASLDSAVSDTYLPTDACIAIEEQMGLVWNSTAGMYLVTDSQRARWYSANGTIDFILASDVSSTDLVTIRLPLPALLL